MLIKKEGFSRIDFKENPFGFSLNYAKAARKINFN